MHSKILNLLEKTETSKFGRFCYYLFLPIFAILEYISFRHYFNLVKSELFTNDDFVAFLDKNEFAYKDNTLTKMDVLPETYIGKSNLLALRDLIRKELSMALVEKIKNITPIDVEQYLNVSVIIYDSTREIPAQHYKAMVRYFRYYVVKQNVWFVPLYLICVTVIYYLYNFLTPFFIH